mgnify:CR=1 FL=1|tara:strand:- start:2222 stop:2887 length:666 start_codon:yes stop_codon:yes gene_type:complete
MSSNSIIFAGYREWALKILDFLEIKYDDVVWHHAKTPGHLNDLLQIKDVGMVILAGWSWILKKDDLSKSLFLGLHPSDLPNYSGGSPIQNQILDGLSSTKMTLFKLSEKIDEGDILYKEDLDLSGGMSNIFESLTLSSIKIMKKLMGDYPELKFYKQSDNGNSRKRLKPSDSNLTSEKINSMTTIELYDFIRCREDPYPNIFIEDKHGKLFFKKVEFLANE